MVGSSVPATAGFFFTEERGGFISSERGLLRRAISSPSKLSRSKLALRATSVGTDLANSTSKGPFAAPSARLLFLSQPRQGSMEGVDGVESERHQGNKVLVCGSSSQLELRRIRRPRWRLQGG